MSLVPLQRDRKTTPFYLPNSQWPEPVIGSCGTTESYNVHCLTTTAQVPGLGGVTLPFL